MQIQNVSEAAYHAGQQEVAAHAEAHHHRIVHDLAAQGEATTAALLQQQQQQFHGEATQFADQQRQLRSQIEVAANDQIKKDREAANVMLQQQQAAATDQINKDREVANAMFQQQQQQSEHQQQLQKQQQKQEAQRNFEEVTAGVAKINLESAREREEAAARFADLQKKATEAIASERAAHQQTAAAREARCSKSERRKG